jgi:hypothetical protein
MRVAPRVRLALGPLRALADITFRVRTSETLGILDEQI